MIKIKSILTVIFFTIINFNFAFGQTNEVHLFNKPSEVTVYAEGAIVNYKYNVNLKKGYNKVYLDSMPNELDLNTIKTSLKGKNLIMATDFRLEPKLLTNGMELPTLSQKYKDSIEIIFQLIDDTRAIINAFESEKSLLDNFTYEQKSEKVNQIKELVDNSTSYRKKLMEVNKEINLLSRQIVAYNKQISNLNDKIESLKEYTTKTDNYQIVLDINSDNANSSEIIMSYYAKNASWSISYDVKVKSITEPLSLIYKANVRQNTGINWENVKLKLSTNNPTEYSSLPELESWYLDIEDSSTHSFESVSYNSVESKNFKANKTEYGGMGVDLGFKNSTQEFATIDEMERASETKTETKYSNLSNIDANSLNLEYELDNLYTINSTNQPYYIEIDKKSIDAKYLHYSVPSVDEKVFLIAQIVDWSNLNLIASNSNIYYQDKFVGSSYIDPENTKDTLELSLGVDKNLTIKRSVSDEMEESKFMSSDNIQFRGYTIKVKNNSKNKVLVKIIEKFPISKNEKIKVELLETSSAKRDSKNGFLAWYKSLESNKSEELKMIFKVEAPEGFDLEDDDE